MEVAIAIIVPFIGTSLGAAMVFFLKEKINEKLQKLLLGFASGVMIAASIWSLIIPSLEMAKEQSQIEYLPAAIGFLLGILFLLLLDTYVPHIHPQSGDKEGVKSNFKNRTMMVFAITLHNIPEGMTVGVLLASVIQGSTTITFTQALVLAIGIALQNFPEGAILSMPLKADGVSKKKAFGLGVLSGIVEPLAAILTILLSKLLVPILPYLLAFAAGAMIYVVVEELIPQSQSGKHSNIAVIGLSIGFVLMMVLDIALG